MSYLILVLLLLMAKIEYPFSKVGAFGGDSNGELVFMGEYVPQEQCFIMLGEPAINTHKYICPAVRHPKYGDFVATFAALTNFPEEEFNEVVKGKIIKIVDDCSGNQVEVNESDLEYEAFIIYRGAKKQVVAIQVLIKIK